jgi:carboxypeptidase family protein
VANYVPIISKLTTDGRPGYFRYPRHGNAPLEWRRMTYKWFTFRRLPAMILVVITLLSAQLGNIWAQDMGKTSPWGDSRNSSEEPQPQLEPQSASAQAPAAEPSARISGAVQDVTGANISGAEVSLIDANESQRSTVTTDPNGNFAFGPIPPGSYRVMVNAKDLEPFESAEILVTAEEVYEMPPGHLMNLAQHGGDDLCQTLERPSTARRTDPVILVRASGFQGP